MYSVEFLEVRRGDAILRRDKDRVSKPAQHQIRSRNSPCAPLAFLPKNIELGADLLEAEAFACFAGSRGS